MIKDYDASSPRLIRDNTPWEDYQIRGVTVQVKREDLSTLPPLPSISKYRGVERVFQNLSPNVRSIGVLDSSHSTYGSGVSTFCKEYGLECFVFYPETRQRNGSIEMARLNDAHLVSMRPNHAKVLWYSAFKQMQEKHGDITSWVMLPNGLHMPETSAAVLQEVKQTTPDDYHCGTWVIPFGRGAVCSGLMPYLLQASRPLDIVLYLGSTRSVLSTIQLSGVNCSGINLPADQIGISIIDEGYRYRDGLDLVKQPWRMSHWYETKAYDWLMRNIQTLRTPVIFWNTGAD